MFLDGTSNHLKVIRSQLESCSMFEYEGTHEMRLQYIECDCCETCLFKYRVKTCQYSGSIELARSHQPECIQKDVTLVDKAIVLKPRGIAECVQKILIKMMKNDTDLTLNLNTVLLKDKWLINVTKRKCNCRLFLKYAICGHILGYVYKNTKLDSEAWFGPKYVNTVKEFSYNVKRGAKNKQNKTKGRYKNSEKALSQY